ncbi:MAG: MFS transporter [Hyphomicrobiales bacterium]|nr:MFS transporter [Hyphomicrobiales bacterium]
MFYGWRVLGITLLTQALQAGLLIYAFGVIILPFAEEFDASRETLMFASALLSLSSNVISPFAGVQVDRRSLRGLMMFGATMMALGFFALSQVRATWQILVVFALILPAGNLLLGQLTSSALMTQWFHRLRGRAMGLSAIGTSIGGLTLPALLAVLMQTYGWRTAFTIIGVAVLIVALPLIRLVVIDRPEQAGLHPDGAQNAIRSEGTETSADTRNWTMKEILSSPVFWRVTITIGIVLSVYLALLANLVPHATDQGISTTTASLLMSILAVFAILGKLGFGLLADKIPLRNALWAAMLLMAAGLMVLLSSASYVALSLACGLLGLAAGGQLPIWGALVARGFGRESFGRALGLMNPAMMPITLVGPPLAGRVFDQTGSYDWAFQMFLAALIVAAIVLAGLRLPALEQAA